MQGTASVWGGHNSGEMRDSGVAIQHIGQVRECGVYVLRGDITGDPAGGVQGLGDNNVTRVSCTPVCTVSNLFCLLGS